MSSTPCTTTLSEASDAWSELLDVIDPTDPDGERVIAQADRLTVHRRGLLHRSVHVLFTRAATADDSLELLLQRRSERKAIGPGRWDLTCAEHVTAGETFMDAARRGLYEELHYRCDVHPEYPLQVWSGAPARLQLYDYPEVGLADYEWNRLYRVHFPSVRAADDALRSLQADAAEVSAWQWMPASSLRIQLRDRPEAFTPWFRDQFHQHLPVRT